MLKGKIEELKEILNEAKSLVVFGRTGSGKTALAWKVLSLIDKPVYFIRHPQPDLLKPFGYINLQSLDEIEDLQDVVIYIDEPQLLLDVSERKMDRIMARILSLARQRDLTIIISTSDTRLLSPRVGEYLEIWCIKDCKYSKTRQRSEIRTIIQENALVSPETFHLLQNEFLFCSPIREANGKYCFGLIKDWSERLSKSYKFSKEEEQEMLREITAQELREPLTASQKKTMQILANHSFRKAQKILKISLNAINQNKKLALKKGYKLEEFQNARAK